MNMHMFTARAGMTIRASTGLEALGEPERMSTVFFYRALPGDRLSLLDNNYLFNVATYVPEIEERFIYTFSYQQNQSWTKYRGDLSGESYRTSDYVFPVKCFFRLCFKRVDEGIFTDAEERAVNDIIRLIPAKSEEEEVSETPDFIIMEAERQTLRIENIRRENSLVFAILTDSHFTVNGTWEDTFASLRAVHSKTRFDAVIHLGDLTDGMVTAMATRQYVKDMKRDLMSLGCPLFIAVGNHDCNYFGQNAEPLSLDEQRELYLSHLGVNMIWYFRDFSEKKMRLIFLHSYEYGEELRYGYSCACLDWLEETLSDTPTDYDVLVFSHLTLLTRLQVWTKQIRGGERLVQILQCYKNGGGRLRGYVNGHNHADQIDYSLGFPVISIGCSKIEFFLEHKPEGSVTPARSFGEASQELWDALIVTPGERELDFIRFGAGQDRRV